MTEEFISEPIKPDPTTFDTKYMSVGAPGLPRQFTWRKQTVKVREIVKTWRTTGPCYHGSNEQYTRRHWFEVTTEKHGTMKIYFDKGKHSKRKEMGWFLYTKEK